MPKGCSRGQKCNGLTITVLAAKQANKVLVLCCTFSLADSGLVLVPWELSSQSLARLALG